MKKQFSASGNLRCNRIMKLLQTAAEFIGVLVGVSLVITAAIIIVHSFRYLATGNVDLAIQDGLFVLILLELFYVVRSFVKYNSVNVGLIVNVGIIAAIKEMVFQLNNINWQISLSFGIIFITLGVLYWMESQYYKEYKEEGQQMIKEDLLLQIIED